MSFWNIPSIEPKLAYRWYISFGDRNIETQTGNNALPHWVCKKVTKPSYQIKHTEHKYLGVHRFNYPTHLEWQPITLTLVDVYNFDQAKFQFTKERKNIDPNKRDNFSVDNKTKERTTIPELADQTITANRSTQLFFYYFLKEAGYIDPNEGIYQDLLARFTQTLTKRKMVGAFIGQNEDYLEDRRSGDPNKTYIDQNTWNTLDINEINEFGQVTEKWKLFNPLITSVKFGELAYETDGVVDISIELVYDWAELVPSDNNQLKKDRMFSNIKINNEINDELLQFETIFADISKRKNNLEKVLKNRIVNSAKNSIESDIIVKDIITSAFRSEYSKAFVSSEKEIKKKLELASLFQKDANENLQRARQVEEKLLAVEKQINTSEADIINQRRADLQFKLKSQQLNADLNAFQPKLNSKFVNEVNEAQQRKLAAEQALDDARRTIDPLQMAAIEEDAQKESKLAALQSQIDELENKVQQRQRQQEEQSQQAKADGRYIVGEWDRSSGNRRVIGLNYSKSEAEDAAELALDLQKTRELQTEERVRMALKGQTTLDLLQQAQEQQAQQEIRGQTISEVRQSEISRQQDQMESAKKAAKDIDAVRRKDEDALMIGDKVYTLKKKP